MFYYTGYNAAPFSIGTLKVYATNIKSMFYNAVGISCTMNLYKNQVFDIL